MECEPLTFGTSAPQTGPQPEEPQTTFAVLETFERLIDYSRLEAIAIR